MIDFTASWCGPCRIMAPIFADLAKKFPNAVFLKVDVDELKVMELMALFTEYRVSSYEFRAVLLTKLYVA